MICDKAFPGRIEALSVWRKRPRCGGRYRQNRFDLRIPRMLLIVGGFYSEIARRKRGVRAQCILPLNMKSRPRVYRGVSLV